jgi:hypothetical protein
MSKSHEQQPDCTIMTVTEPPLSDECPTILTLRPAPGHPLAFVAVENQEGTTAPTTEEAATWANLHDLAHQWGAVASTLPALASPVSGHLFQALGMAFLALSHEESAYAQYFLVSNRLRYPPSTVAEGLEQTGVELHEALVNWTGVGLWLERLANDGHFTSHVLETVRTLITQVRVQQHRLWSLQLRVQDEHARLTRREAACTKEEQA